MCGEERKCERTCVEDSSRVLRLRFEESIRRARVVRNDGADRSSVDQTRESDARLRWNRSAARRHDEAATEREVSARKLQLQK